MRKLLFLLGLAIVLVFVTLTADAATDFEASVCGDADGNRDVDIDDVVYLIAYIFSSGPDPVCTYGAVEDIDGNTYLTVKIGDQWWMMENLKVAHYRDGDPIPNVTDAGEWSGLSTGAYCEYDNDPASVGTYGRLYNWYAVNDSRNIAPEGWHVPTDGEWKQLEMYLGMSQGEADSTGYRGTDEGGKLKEAGTAHWNTPNTGATNESGFSALPGGYRAQTGVFDVIGDHGYCWCSTASDGSHAWYRGVFFDRSQVRRLVDHKRMGVSVRCVRD